MGITANTVAIQFPSLRKPIFALAGCSISFGVALVASLLDTSKWRVFLLLITLPVFAMFFAAIRSIKVLAGKSDIFSPLFAFPVLYAGWFALGSVDLIEVPRRIAFGLFEPIPKYVLMCAALGLLAYIAGARLVRANANEPDPFSHPSFDWIEGRFWLVVAGLCFLLVASFGVIVTGMGVIPLLVADAGEVRLRIRGYGPEEAVMFTAAWSLIPIVMMYVWLRRPGRRLKILCYVIVILAGVSLVSLGGRSYLFVPALATLVARHYAHKRFRPAKLLLLAGLTFSILSVFGYVRDTSLTGSTVAADELGIPSTMLPFSYAYLYIRYPVATFRDITTMIPQKIPYHLGALTFGPLATLFPGHHEQSDMFFKDILGNDFVGAGQPATLLGPLYADAGVAGIVFGLFLFAQLIARAYRRMRTHSSAINILLYAWLLQTLLFSLFSNLFPYITTLWIPVFWIALNTLMRRRLNGA